MAMLTTNFGVGFLLLLLCKHGGEFLQQNSGFFAEVTILITFSKTTSKKVLNPALSFKISIKFLEESRF
jgi:hypothetical protein